MSLVFAGIVPHTPLLIRGISRDSSDLVKDSLSALDELKEQLYIARPEIIIILSAYTQLFENAFSVNAHNGFNADFSEFGDLTTTKKWQGAPSLAAYISKKARAHGENVRLISEERVDHGISVPLLLATEKLPNVAILPIGPNKGDNATLLKFGELLKEVIYEQQKRVAVIVSGHLSHKTSTTRKWLFKFSDNQFDKTLIGHLEQRNIAAIISMDKKKIESADESMYRSLLILLGIIKNMNCTFKTSCYEAPVGVGYLTGNFNI